MPQDRRSFLRNLGIATAAVWGGPRLLSTFSIAPAGAAVSPAGTTLAETVVPIGDSGGAAYTKMTYGPGWPTVVRHVGVEPKPAREHRRVALASIVHLTDIHVIDGQSPARVEFLDRYNDPPTNESMPFSSAFRPQETLTAQVSESMVRRINEVGAGPITGRSFDCAVCTGDNIDNQQRNEMEWHLAVLNGGSVTPNSGDPSKYEGVQDNDELAYDAHYWHPETDEADNYKTVHGFPAVEGMLSAAIGTFQAGGLNTRWFTVYGNHDGLLQGNSPDNPVFSAIAVGGAKVVNLPAGMSPGDFYHGISSGDPAVLAALATAPARPVTPDANRAIVSSTEWIAAHRAAGNAGPGPVGHGFTEENEATGALYYTFAIAPGVTGISLDTVNRGGYAAGSIGTKQLAWLEARLAEELAAGRLVVIFSHHGISTMNNPVPDPPNIPASDPQRVTGAAVEAALHKYTNVIAWVNGHTHRNRVTPRPHPTGANQGFWEISTAAHVDWPQHARLIEVADNRDGTISIFATLIEHAAPATPEELTEPTGDQVLRLSSLARELAWNDPHVHADAAGSPEDRNVELVLAAPPVAALSGSAASGGATLPGSGDEIARGAELPATGAPVPLGGAFGVGAALLGGVLAVRERGRRSPGGGDAGVDTAGDEA